MCVVQQVAGYRSMAYSYSLNVCEVHCVLTYIINKRYIVYQVSEANSPPGSYKYKQYYIANIHI